MDGPNSESDAERITTRYTNYKPILIVVCTRSIDIWARFPRVFLKLQRDAQLTYATNLTTLDVLLDLHGPSVAGIIVADGQILDDGAQHDALSARLVSLVKGVHAPAATPHEYTVVFAFDFPTQAARRPFRFARYMQDTFALPWMISGCTVHKIKLRLRTRTLRKMGPRGRYRRSFDMKAVFLRRVKMADKLLVATGEFGPGGQPDEVNWVTAILRPEHETSTTDGEEEAEDGGGDGQGQDEEEAVGSGGSDMATRDGVSDSFPCDVVGPREDGTSHRETPFADGTASDGSLADDELDDADTSVDEAPVGGAAEVEDADDGASIDPNWVPSDDEGTIADMQVADSPVVIHQVKTWVDGRHGGEATMMRGYVGFIGHMEDNRSMSSILLGMCAVRRCGRT
ncbi:hypothetical protein BDV59DRAFT_196850 [Aspergillus ambiguus]|uniref:uncharacterized protein n=1 Tax=Aspergillus ambiguus TaxID=176160 RepID=UPI003CCDDD67